MRDDRQPSDDPVAATLTYDSIPGVSRDDRESALGRSSGAIASTSWEGRVLGDFVLGDILGEGGCGTAYRAEQRALGRAAVVKVMHHRATQRPAAAERFAREAQLASRFDHPYAAHVYAFGVEPDDVMWIAMELVDGTPLNQLFRQAGPQTPEQFVPLFERLCEVVQSAHEQGIVHRDIKPSNVMVIERAGRLMPKLLDFGTAKVLPVGDDTAAVPVEPAPPPATGSQPLPRELTHEGQLLGSPAYMAPEQWRDPTSAGPAADQYALALLAYEALTGSHAFAGPTLEVLAEQHRVAALPALPPHLPSALHAVLSRATDKLPEQRFSSLTELANALRRTALGAASDDESDHLPAPIADVSPYPGLAAFTRADQAWFVGREREVEEMIDRLRTQPIVTVVGPSGCGKSSFLAAGLIPSLGPGWHAELVRPGGDPCSVLAGFAAPSGESPYRARHYSTPRTPVEIAAGLVGVAEVRGVDLVVVVDQAEELFTMCADDAARAAFAEALVDATKSARIRVVLALRDDFLCQIEQLEAWRGLLGRAVHVLGAPRNSDLERMITEPARRRGFGFDDHALPAEIANEVADRVGALPLVAFTLAQLWEHRDRRLRRLTRSAYYRIGGVTGALVQHADNVIDQMSIPDRRYVRLVFRRLITAEGARTLVSRADLESSLGAGPAALVIDRLLAARLIVSRDDDTGDRIEIIHETLATTWPRLAAWRREEADGTRLQEQLTTAARLWNERERPTELLWRGDALSDLRRWDTGADRNLTTVERAFVRACIVTVGRIRRTWTVAVALAFAVLVAGIVGLVSANREITAQRAAAVERLYATFAERGRTAIAAGDHARGLLYLAEAGKLGAGGRGFDFLASHAAVSLEAGLEIIGHRDAGMIGLAISDTQIVTLDSRYTLSGWDRAGKQTHLADHAHYVTLIGDLAGVVLAHGDVAAIDPSGGVRWRAERAVVVDPASWGGIAGSAPARLVVAFGTAATLRDADTGRSRGELAHDHNVTAVAFDARGVRLATGDSAGFVRIWDTATAAVVATCEPHAGAVRAIKFASDGGRVVSGGNDGRVRICNTATGATLHQLDGHRQPVVAIDIAPDDQAIVSGGRDEPRIWDAQTGALVGLLEGHRGTVGTTQFSPSGQRILTLGFDGTARIWDRNGTALGSLQGHAGQVFAGSWDHDGRHILTTSVDGAIRRWDTERAVKLAVRQAHRAPITELAISRDDRWLLTAAGEPRAALWDRRSLQVIAELSHDDDKIVSVAFSPDATGALTTGASGSARIWRLPDGALAAELPAGTIAAAYAPSGEVVTAGRGAIRWWSRDGAALGAAAIDYDVHRLVVDPSGRWVFAPGEASAVAVFDLARRAEVTRLTIRGAHARALAVDGATVAISDEATIRLWELATWAPRGTLVGHATEVAALWFVSGRLVSASWDATMVWERSRLAAQLPDTNRVFALAAFPDGKLFATAGSDGAIRVWDAASYRLLVQMPVHRLPSHTVQISHDGATAISGGNDGRLAVWNLAQPSRSISELAALVRCRVPLRLEDDIELPRALDFDDPACQSQQGGIR